MSCKYRLNRTIFDHNTFFRFVICEGPTGLKKINPPKFFNKFSQGPARDQSGTKIGIHITANGFGTWYATLGM